MAAVSGYSCCKSSLGKPAERSIVYLEDTVHQVLAVYDTTAILIPKYIVGNGPLYSHPLASTLKRVVWHYRPREVASHASTPDPCFGAKVSTITWRVAPLVCDPYCRRRELWSPRDELEEVAALLLAELDRLGVAAYPTGSLLGYYHDPLVSDIDLVVYVERRGDCSGILEGLGGVLRPLPSSMLSAWTVSRGVDERVYRVWMRGVYMDREVSIVFGLKRPRRDCEVIVASTGAVRVERMMLEPGGCEALVWPHVGWSTDYKVVLSFDGIYSPLLLEGGCIEVRGVEARVILDGVELEGIITGVSEINTWIRPC